MAFRKRSIVPQSGRTSSLPSHPIKPTLPLGIRPSPLDGRFTTSTGTHSLDSLLSGHSGLVLGTSLFVEENGTTDFAGALLKYYAAEGVVQGHYVHVLGMHEGWGRELPGVGAGEKRKDEQRAREDKMKIAWRYERLGEFGAGARDKHPPQQIGASDSPGTAIFCHDFDMSKRLILPSPSRMTFVPTSTRPNFDPRDLETITSPFTGFLNHLTSQLSAVPNTVIHRIVIPNLLSPAIYPVEAARPEHVLQFLHALRALLRSYATNLTAMITLPLALYPRTTGLTRWMELLSDGVLELMPFPSTAVATKSSLSSTLQEELPQGMLKIHRLPVFHERGGGGGEASGFGDDLAFTLSRRKGLVIKPFSLPPVEGDIEGQQGRLEHEHGKATKIDIEF
ncbi:paxneb protein superfamily [Diplocarpon rosae]|nr:paxneb protein superfamily [Diplocarpon rosae]